MGKLFPMAAHEYKTRRYLAQNLRFLMSASKVGPTELERQSKVSRKTINNILNERHPPELDNIEALAKVFGLNMWQIILPNLPKDLKRCQSLGQLLKDYMDSPDEGQGLIELIASREAAGKK